MKNLSLFLLLCLLFAACAKDENKEPILVTDIVMPTQTSFNPGDKVTIKAQGFQTDDDIMFEIYWPLPRPTRNELSGICPRSITRHGRADFHKHHFPGTRTLPCLNHQGTPAAVPAIS